MKWQPNGCPLGEEKMALNIIKPNQIMPVNAIKVYYYGDPGRFKTTIGMTADKPLLIDADKGAYRTGINRRGDVLVAEKWTDICHITEQDLAPYNTIVFDTIGRVLELIKSHLASERQNTKSDGSLKLNVQGVANNMFGTFVNRIISYGKDVVFIAHSTEDKNDSTIFIRPDLGGKNRQEIYRLADAMAHLVEEMNSQGVSNKILKFNGGDNCHTKDSGNIGNIIVPDLRLSENANFLAKVIENIKHHLNTMTPEQQAEKKLQLDWEQWVKSCAEAQYVGEFNTLIESLNDDHPYFKPMWDCMKQYAKNLGFSYIKEKCRWIEPELTTITDAQRDELQTLLVDIGLDVMTFCKDKGIDSLMAIETQHFDNVKAELINTTQGQGQAIA